MNPSIYHWVLAWTGLALSAAVILILTMWPTPIDRGYGAAIDRVLQILHNRGVPEWFGYRKFEFSANVLMFVPFGFFISLSLPFKYLWVALLAIPAFSVAIELTQSMFLDQRFSPTADVVAYSLGGFVGLLVANIFWVLVRNRDSAMAKHKQSLVNRFV